MKKNDYVKPCLEVFFFHEDDIVTSSPNINAGAEGSDDDIFSFGWHA